MVQSPWSNNKRVHASGGLGRNRNGESLGRRRVTLVVRRVLRSPTDVPKEIRPTCIGHIERCALPVDLRSTCAFAIDRMAKRTLGIHVLLGRLAESGSARAGGPGGSIIALETPSPHSTMVQDALSA